MNSNTQKDETPVSKESNVKVVVRVRPPNDRELAQGKCNVVKVVDDFMLTFDPKENDGFGPQKTRVSILEKKIRDLNFMFDRVFNNTTTNEEVFEHTTKSIIQSVLEGYNCSVFAYGATSAGKTHTMLGSPNQPGVIFLTMMELYKKLMAIDEEFQTDISVSYLEIYNETCKDLLLPTGPLAVREDPEKGVCVAGLSLHKPRSAEELLEMLHFGNQNRTQHPTDANKQSSRSHAVFQVFVRQCPKASGISTNVKVAKISLIDLAGSERATVTTNHGERLREGANINKSLLALGNCINALAENKSNLHVPYRNSKLTRLLKDSLGGNCRTIMIAAISPSTLSYEDTYNTLKYANRAKNIKSSLVSNTLNVDLHVSQYVKIIEDMKSQISVLQKKLEEADNVGTSEKNIEVTQEQDKSFWRYKEHLSGLFHEKKLFVKQLIDCEAGEKEIMLKLMHKERSYKRLEIIRSLNGQSIELAFQKLDNLRTATKLKQSQCMEQASRLKASLNTNREQIMCIQKEIDAWANQTTDNVRNQINSLYESLNTDISHISFSTKYKHAKRHLTLQDADQKNNEKLISQLLEIITAQQNKLNVHPEVQHGCMDGQLRELPGAIMDGPKISWADQSSLSSERENHQDNNVSFYLDFKSCTPLKTPSRKPSVLRQIVRDSRDCLGGEKDTLEFNTTMNTGPIRFKLPPAPAREDRIDQKENMDSTFSISRVAAVISDEERRKTFVVSAPHPNNETIVLSPVDTERTYTCSDVPDTPPSTDFAKSCIPVRTPLKSIDNKNNTETTSTKTRPRMRSFTEGSTKEYKHDRTFAVAKPKKKRFLNVGLPTRSASTLNLNTADNVKPKLKSRGLRTAQSLVSLTNEKSSKHGRGRFRF